jgi:hypothetical protein
VVAATTGVAERRALLGGAVDLTDERVDIDHEPPVTRPPGAHARLSASPTDMPGRKAAQECPNVDGVATGPPSSAPVRPARTMSQSSIESAPSAIAYSSVITLRPRVSRAGARAQTDESVDQRLDPNLAASAATRAIPAFATARSSSKRTPTPFNPTGPSACTMKVTS